MNRELDNSVLISLPRFFFPPLLFLSMIFYNISNDRARTTFEKLTFERHREVIKKEKKKQGYICRTKIGILFDINECLLLFLPRICPVPRQTFPIVRVRGKGNSRKRNVYITRREGNIIETLRTIEYFYEEGGSRERSLA